MDKAILLLILLNSPFIILAQVIDEIQFNTSGTDDEWVEICNPDQTIKNVADFTLSVNGTIVFTFPSGATIPAEGCITIGLGDDGDATDNFNDECPFTPTYLRTGLVLNSATANTNILPNSTGQITLRNASAAMVDEILYDDQDLGSSNDLANEKTFTLIALSFANETTDNFNWVVSLDPGGSPNLPGNVSCPSAQTELSFITTASSENENAGTLSTTVCVNIERPSFDVATTVEVVLTGGSATNGSDIDLLDSPLTLTFPAGSFSTKCIEITIIDDSVTEGNENLEFSLQNPAGGRNMATLGNNTIFDLNIIDDDVTIAVMNEVLFNPLGSTGDNEREFFEIRGTPNGSLANMWLISIDGDGTSAGRINAEIDLSSYVLGSNGLLLVRDTGPTFTPAPDLASTVVSMDFGSSIFQNGTGTFLLVTNHNQSINDIDSNNDGTIDLTSWDMVLDAVSVTDGGASDRVYANLLGGTDLPRHQGNTTAHGVFRGETDEWLAATSQAGSSGNFEFDFVTVWNSADEAIAVNTIMPPQFTPGNIGQLALAIEDIDFFATQQAEYVVLEWRVFAEEQPPHFQISKSADGITFSPIHRTSSILNKSSYRFLDSAPQIESNYYQLSWHDEFGVEQFSKIIQVKYLSTNKIKVFPTIVRDQVMIEGLLPNTLVTILNQLGKIVFQQKVSEPIISIPLFTKGIYFMQINQQQFQLIKIE
ncbi:MAG: Calx-beta domain-containing protein [Saprospiraceae bacterium]